MVDKVVDIYIKDFSVYHYREWYWIIHPESREWVVNVSDSGYTFFNRDFWLTISNFCSLNDITDDIRNWVVNKLGVPFSEHCHPDYIPMDYDWRDEFGEQLIIDVLNKGEKIK